MSECRIKEALHTLHRKSALMTNIYWKLEEKYSIEYMGKFQKSMTSTKGNFLQLLSDRDGLLEPVELLYGESLKDEEEI